MAWRTDISVLLFVVIALAKGNLNVIGEWNLYGSLTPNHNSHQITPTANYRYQINHIKAAAPPTVPPRKDRTNARLSGAPVVQFSASKSNDQMVSSFSAASPQMGPTQAQIDSLNAFKNALGSQKMVLIDKHMGQVQIQPGSFTDRVVIRDPSRAITYSKPYSVSHRKLTPWQQPPSTLPPTMPAKARPQIIIATSPPVKPRFQFTIADGLKVRRGNIQYVSSRQSQNTERQHTDQHFAHNQSTTLKELSPVEIDFLDNGLPRTTVIKHSKQRTNTSINYSLTDITSQQNRQILVVDFKQPNNHTYHRFPDIRFKPQTLACLHKRNKRQTTDHSGKRNQSNRMRDIHTVLMGNASLVDSFARKNRAMNEKRIKNMKERRKQKRTKKRLKTKMKSVPLSSKTKNKKKKSSPQKSAQSATPLATDDVSLLENMDKNVLVSELGRRRTRPERKQINPNLTKPEIPSVDKTSVHKNRPKDSHLPLKQIDPSRAENNGNIDHNDRSISGKTNKHTHKSLYPDHNVNLKSKVRLSEMQNTGFTPRNSIDARFKHKTVASNSPRLDRQRLTDLPSQGRGNSKLSPKMAQNRIMMSNLKRPKNIYIVISSGRSVHSRGKGMGIRKYSANDRARYRYIENLITRGHAMMERLQYPPKQSDNKQYNHRSRGGQRNRAFTPRGRSRSSDFEGTVMDPSGQKRDLNRKNKHEFNENKINNLDKSWNKDNDMQRKNNPKNYNESKMKNAVNPKKNLSKSQNEDIYFVNATDNIDQGLRNILSNPMKVISRKRRMKSNRGKLIRGRISSGKNQINRHLNNEAIYPHMHNGPWTPSRSLTNGAKKNEYGQHDTSRRNWSSRKPDIPSLFKNEHPLTRPFNPFPGRRKRHRNKIKNSKRKSKIENQIKRKQILNSNNDSRQKYDSRKGKRKRGRYGQYTTNDTIRNIPKPQENPLKDNPRSVITDSDIPVQNISVSKKHAIMKNSTDKQKSFDGSRGSNIRLDNDFVKYQFLEAYTKRANNLSGARNHNEATESRFDSKARDEPVSKIDYDRVDGYSTYSVQNNKSSGVSNRTDKSRKKSNVEIEKSKKTTILSKQKSSQSLVNNLTEEADFLTKHDENSKNAYPTKRNSDRGKLGKFSSSEREFNLIKLGKLSPTFDLAKLGKSSSTKREPDQGKLSKLSSNNRDSDLAHLGKFQRKTKPRNQRKKKKRGRNYNKNSQILNGDRTWNIKRKRHKEHNKSKIRKRRSSSRMNSMVSLKVYLKRLFQLRDSPNQRKETKRIPLKTKTSFNDTKANGMKTSGRSLKLALVSDSAQKSEEKEQKNTSTNKSGLHSNLTTDLNKKNNISFSQYSKTSKTKSGTFVKEETVPSDSEVNSTGLLFHTKTSSRLHINVSNSQHSVLTSDAPNTNNSTSQAVRNLSIVNSPPSMRKNLDTPKYLPKNTNIKIAAYPLAPRKTYDLINLKSYLNSGSNTITKKTKRHSIMNLPYDNKLMKPSLRITNKREHAHQHTNQNSYTNPQHGGGLTQLPMLTFTTTNGTLTKVSGVAGLRQRKLGINVTLTRLAEIKTNLLSQILSPGNAQGAGGRGAHPPNHGPPPGPIYPANPPPAHHAAPPPAHHAAPPPAHHAAPPPARHAVPPPARHAAPPPARHAAPPQAHYNPPLPSWNPPPRHTQNQWNQPPPQQYYQNHPPTHPPRYLPPPTHPPRHYFPPHRRTRPTPAPYRPPKTTKTTTTTTTTTKKPEIEYDIEGPRTTQAPPPTRTRPTARPKCDYWSMDQFGNLQFFPCQRPIFRPPTTTPAPAPVFYFYDVATQDPWKWYDYPNEVKIEVKVERDKRTK